MLVGRMIKRILRLEYLRNVVIPVKSISGERPRILGDD